MPSIIELNAHATVFSAAKYPRSNGDATQMGLCGSRNEEMRALTIAAFRVAQNNSQLSTRKMNAELLLHLLAASTTALNYWVDKGRLSRESGSYSLTPEGLAECQNTLLGMAGAYSTTESKVQEWVSRLTSGDQVAAHGRTFPASAWSVQ